MDGDVHDGVMDLAACEVSHCTDRLPACCVWTFAVQRTHTHTGHKTKVTNSPPTDQTAGKFILRCANVIMKVC